MNAIRHTRPWALLLLGGLLWALPAAAQQGSGGNRCEADCATKASAPMQACVTTCPQPHNSKDMKATAAYQGCAARCSSHFQERFATCKKKCPDSKKPPKK